MITGVRYGGDRKFHFKIHSRNGSKQPPMTISMPLRELQAWLATSPEELPRASQFRPRPIP